MMAAQIYGLAGALLFGVGLSGVCFCPHPLRKILAVNLAGSGVFLMLVASARRQTAESIDPIPQALVLTGIVVAVSATAMALVLYRRLATSAAPLDEAERPRG